MHARQVALCNTEPSQGEATPPPEAMEHACMVACADIEPNLQRRPPPEATRKALLVAMPAKYTGLKASIQCTPSSPFLVSRCHLAQLPSARAPQHACNNPSVR
jgi:hypothetical protein